MARVTRPSPARRAGGRRRPPTGPRFGLPAFTRLGFCVLRLAVTFALTAALGEASPTPRPAPLHPPPMLYFVLRLDDQALVVQTQVKRGLFPDWFPFDWEDVESVAAGERPDDRQAVESFFADHCEVAIDGVPVKGKLIRLERMSYFEHSSFHQFVALDLSYATKGRPSQVSLHWQKYDDYPTWWRAPIDGELNAFGKDFFFTVNRDDPRFVWKAPAADATAPLTLPPLERPRTVDIPVLSLAAICAMLLVALLAWRRAVRPITLLATAAIGLGVAILLWNTGRVGLRPPWEAAWTMPDEARAQRIFEALHRNIYRAFDYSTESDIYDTLAHSVTGDLLDSIYREVYQNWFFRSRGGAVCRISSTEILESRATISPSSIDPIFQVECRWRVHGVVRHWGHTHTRINEYLAGYTVRYTPAGWRIASADLTDQHRVGLKDPRAWPLGAEPQ